jgi:hypothetical protein
MNAPPDNAYGVRPTLHMTGVPFIAYRRLCEMKPTTRIGFLGKEPS